MIRRGFRSFKIARALVSSATVAFALAGCQTQITTLRNAASVATDAGISGVPPQFTSLTVLDASPTNNFPLALDWGLVVGSHTQYCILENATDPLFCVWKSGSLPTAYNDFASDGPLVLTAFLKNAYGVSASVDSNSVTIDRTPPNGATTLGWTQVSPNGSTSLQASWTKSTSTDLSDQTIQFYTGGMCGSALGAPVSLGNGTAQTQAWTAPGAGTYSYRLTSADAAGNTALSGCSAAMVVDLTPPTAAASLGWSESSPRASTSVTAAWTRSGDLDLVNQRIQFYSDASCGTATGPLIDLASASAQNYAWTAPGQGPFTYKITSYDTAGLTSVSACSSTMTIDTTAPLAASALGWAETSPHGDTGVNANWTKSASADLANQSIQFYSDAGCATTSGSAIALGSATAQAYAFTAPGAGTYAYTVTSTDGAGNSSVSACSSSMLIDLTAPVGATGLGWTDFSPVGTTSVTAAWTKSASADLSDQHVQFYSDASCTTASGSEIDLTSAAQSHAWTAPGGGTYSYRVRGYDAAGNNLWSACSSAMVIDLSAPAAATGIDWAETSPHGDTGVNAQWTKSGAADLANQTLQFYSDGTCGTTSGGVVNLASNALETYAWTAPGAGAYSYKVTSVDGVGNSAVSACSSAMTIDLTPPAAATALGWVETSPHGSLSVNASWTKSAATDLANQTIRFYTDAACTTASGASINLGSATAQTYGWSAPATGIYYYAVTSIDAAGHSTASACSSAMDVDTTGPANATGLGWAQSSPYNSTSVDATWTKSVAADLANQTLQFYSDAGCTTTSGGVVNLSSNTLETYAWTAPGAGTFAYKVTSVDSVANSSVSACSSPITIDLTAPAAATALAWAETSPHGDTGVTANWTKSAAADLANQTIRFYTDAACSTASGAAIDLASTTLQTKAWTAPGAGTFYFQVTSVDAAGNSAASACSAAMTIDLTPPAAATALGWTETSPHGDTSVTAAWTKSADAGLGDQTIQFYSDAGCTTTSGSEIDLASADSTYAWTAPGAGSFKYKIKSVDGAGNSTVSACSSAMVIDLTAPDPATAIGWTETSPHGDTGVEAAWTPSASADLADQHIQFYSDAGCATASGSEIDLTSADSTYAWTAPGAGTFAYRVRTYDTAGNATWSSCSSAMTIDLTPPAAATALGWNETSPYNSASVTAAWTKSAATDLANQKIRFYTDAGCTTASGAEIDLASASVQTKAWTAPGDGTYRYILTSVDASGHSTASACSSAMTIDTTAPAAPTALGWSNPSPGNSLTGNLTWTKSASPDVASQFIRTYSDGTCTTVMDPWTDIGSASDQSFAATAPSGGTYSFQVRAVDAAGNSATSVCSSAIVIDVTAPANATALGWVQTSPHGTMSVTASWTKSVAADLGDQSIQFYSDNACGTASGTAIDLTSASASYAWTAPGASFYTYKITSVDTAGNAATSACSSALEVVTNPTLASVDITNATPTSNREYSLTYGATTTYDRYCILENDTDVNHCVWHYGTLPSSKFVKNVNGAKVFSVWLKNAADLVSTRVNSDSVTFTTTAVTAWDRGNTDFLYARAGSYSVAVAYWFMNRSAVTTASCSAPILTGGSSSQFMIVSDGCGATQMAPGQGCKVVVRFRPSSAGGKSTTLRRTCGHGNTNATLSGTGLASTDKPTTIAAGGSSTLFSVSSGYGYAFGRNSEGQLGTWAPTEYRFPARMLYNGAPTAVTDIARIDAGQDHGCILTTGGTVACFGDATYGAPGNNWWSPNIPADVGLTGVASIGIGYQTSCAVKSDNSLYCWGRNDNREVANTATGAYGYPELRPGVSAIDAGPGRDHTCVVLTDNTVQCWGEGSSGRLGNGSNSDNYAGVAVTGISNAVDVESGDYNTCALLSDKTVKCWGMGGVNGDGTTSNRNTPVVVQGLSRIAQITAGSEFFCARDENGDVYCWGYGSSGEVNPAARTTVELVPFKIPGITEAYYVSAGDSHVCALLGGGEVNCWGANTSGQLGSGLSQHAVRRAYYGTTIANVASAVAGTDFRCIAMTDGTAKCWGDGSEGTLGNGQTAQQHDPVTVPGLTGVAQIVAGEDHVCARITDGTVKCWGKNSYGAVGSGALNAIVSTPTAVPGLTGVAYIAAGEFHTCVALTDKTVKCWGRNNGYQLGDGSTTNSTSPVVATGATGVVQLGLGATHSCAARDDGTAYCWGHNAYGQIGDGSTTAAQTPKLVPQLGGVTKVSAAWGHTVALLTDGTAKCWGSNTYGECGDGTATNLLSPKLIPVAGISDVGAYGRFTAYLDATGRSLWWSGNSQSYQAGDGSSYIPGAVNATYAAIGVSAASLSTGAIADSVCGIDASANLNCWGSNSESISNQGQNLVEWHDGTRIQSWKYLATQTIDVDSSVTGKSNSGVNDFTDLVAGTMTDMVNTSNVATTVDLAITQRFNSVNSAGANPPGNWIPFIGDVTYDSFFGSTTNWAGVTAPQATVVLSGLDPAKAYTLQFFASRTGAADNRETLYTAIGATTDTAVLDAANNTEYLGTILNVTPTAGGQITINVEKGPNNNNVEGFYYLNALRIKTYQ